MISSRSVLFFRAGGIGLSFPSAGAGHLLAIGGPLRGYPVGFIGVAGGYLWGLSGPLAGSCLSPGVAFQLQITHSPLSSGVLVPGPGSLPPYTPFLTWTGVYLGPSLWDNSIMDRSRKIVVLGLAGVVLLSCYLLTSGCKPRFSSVSSIETSFLQIPVTLNLVVTDPEESEQAVTLAVAEILRLETKFDPLNPQGNLYQLNNARSVNDPEFYMFMEQVSLVSEMTGGGLNIFMGYLEQAYGFGRRFPSPPDPDLISEMLLPLGRANIQFNLERFQVSIPDDAFSVSLSGIQEGYVADQALAHLVYAGLSNAMVQVGFHVACGGSADGTGWQITVPHPVSGAIVARLFVENCGVAIASIADQAYAYRGETYYNHLDPDNGRPASSLIMVTVVAPTCQLAASLAQGIFVIGPEEGLSLLNRLPDTEGILLDPEGGLVVTDSLLFRIEG